MKQIIIPPEGGWKGRCYYLVEVAYHNNNPIRPAIFYTGFLDENGNPSGYNEILRTDGADAIESVKYMRAIRMVLAAEDFVCPNQNKLIGDL